ncbi:MAG: putative DNA binding domain-containing protein [Sideroxydans sp.]|nr:putative DNA binding domain-containing protein [Sideroxydans sp.]
MLEIKSIADIEALRESFEVECKLAAGRDGKGELPKDFWATYSALANSYGGDVLLGVKENAGRFQIHGIVNHGRVIEELWNNLNNSQKVSANLLNEQHVQVIDLDGQSVIRIHVPRAARKSRPVYIGGNPITGTYKRQNSGDYQCDEESVRRMLAEQVEDSRDNEILQGYGLNDIDVESFNAYRNLYAARSPDHPWNQGDPQTFMRNIGAWRIDRETGQGGFTRAGLLMFGRLPSIQEAFPNYMLDYQERAEAKTEARWVDRLTLDGSWSGNLFDFYRRVIKKLTSDLKVPFSLEGDLRKDDTAVHQALREALVNTLVHADYSGRASVLVVKRPDMFGFRNPGLMRVPQEIAVAGGDSDCRNRLLHQMFRYIGLGEQAGSGIPKIYQGWDSQHWRAPLLVEKEQPSEQTLLELRMLSLLPEGAVRELRESLGKMFDHLPHLEQLILAAAATEQTVTHRRMAEISTEHAHDLTLAFQRLVKSEILESSGHGKGTVYHLPGQNLPTPDQAFGDGSFMSGAQDSPSDLSSGHNDLSSGHNDCIQPKSARHEDGHLLVKGLNKPLIDNIALLPDTLRQELMSVAEEARNKPRMAPDEMTRILTRLCKDVYLTQQVLAELVNRKPEALRKNTLKPLVDSGHLALAFPTVPTHPQQAYTSNKGSSND